jgi:hypothetical protein
LSKIICKQPIFNDKLLKMSEPLFGSFCATVAQRCLDAKMKHFSSFYTLERN